MWREQQVQQQADPATTTLILKTIGYIAGTATIVAGVNYAISVVSDIFTNNVNNSPGPEKLAQETRQAITPRRKLFGTVRVAGAYVFWESKDGKLYKLLINGFSERVETLERRINNKVVYLGASGDGRLYADAAKAAANDFNGDQYKGKIVLVQRPGTVSQSHISEISSAFTAWTSDHKALGCALSLLICESTKAEDFRTVYITGGEPTYTELCKWSRWYDPRKDSTNGGSGTHRLDDPATWEWTDNYMIVRAGYEMDADGGNLGSGGINWVNIAEQADICDQTYTARDGSTQKRYRMAGAWDLTTPRSDVRKAMNAACVGEEYTDADGKFCYRVGYWIEPTVHITDAHILSVQASKGPSDLDATKAIKIVYTDPALEYVQTEAAAVYGDALVSDEDVDARTIYYIPHHNQACRVGKILKHLQDAAWELTITTDMAGFAALGHPFIRVTVELLGITARTFRIVGMTINPGDKTAEISVRSIDEAAYQFATDEEGDPPSIPGSTSSPLVIPAPEDLDVDPEQVDLGATNGVRLAATWNMPTRDDLSFQAQLSVSGAENWAEMSVDQDAKSAVSGVVTSGLEYDVRIRSVTAGGKTSDWTRVDDVLAVANNDDPTPPTVPAWNSPALTTPAAGQITLSWTNGAASNHFATEIYRNTSNSIPGSPTATIGGSFGQSQTWTDTGRSTGVTYYYWLKAINVSDVASAATASQSIAAT